MKTLLLAIQLVLIYYANGYAQSNCLEPIEHRKINYLLDNREWLIEQARLDSITLIEYQEALNTSNQLLIQARNEATNQEALKLIALDRSKKLEDSFNKAEKRIKRRERVIWITSTVSVVESVFLGIYFGTR
jgi:hypothetical protein